MPWILLGWVIARALLLGLIAFEPGPITDLNYYHANLDSGLGEYPHASVWPLHLLDALSADRAGFVAVFIGMCLLLDAGFLLLLLRLSTPAAAWFWILAGTACGQVLYMRLDIIPALLVAMAALLLITRPRVSAALLAFATAVKLWPGVLAAGLVGRLRARGTWVRVLWFFGALALICLATVLTAGFERLISPLSYQGERGLQIESVLATPLMLAAHGGASGYEIAFAESKSWEITGPGVSAMVSVADAAQLLVVLAAFVWALVSLRRGFCPRATVMFWVSVIAWLILTNKVFSPQYIIWLVPVAAVAIGIRDTGLTRTIGMLLALSAALGVYIYPFHYGELANPDSGLGAAVLVLGLRNLLILAITVLATLETFRTRKSEVEELGKRGGAAQTQQADRQLRA